MKGLVKIMTVTSVLLFSHVALANNQTKLNVAKKALQTGDISPYATSSLKQQIRQADMVQFQIDDQMGCEFSEHYFLGWGHDKPNFNNLKMNVLSSGVVSATFHDGEYGHRIEFDMVCKSSSCSIDDVKSGTNTDSKAIPNYTNYSIRDTAWYIVNYHQCPQ